MKHPTFNFLTIIGITTFIFNLNTIAQVSFSSPVDYPSNGSISVAVGDFNQDGRPDVVYANRYDHNISVLIASGAQGNFNPPVNYAVGNNPSRLAISDLNADGSVDIVVPNRGSNTLSILFGNSDGTFNPATSVSPGIGTPTAMAIADLNGDGRQDLVTASGDNPGSISVLLATGSPGSFGTPSTPITTDTQLNLALGDLNGDGLVDLVLVTASATLLHFGNGDGTFGSQNNLGNIGGFNVQLGDLNGDNRIDIAVGTSGGPILFFATGSPGNFATGVAANISTGGDGDVAIADLNSDGRPDLAASFPQTSFFAFIILQANGPLGNFNGPFGFSFGGGSVAKGRALAIADLNLDSKPDIIICEETFVGIPVKIFFNTTPAQVPNITNFNPTSGPIGTSLTITGTNFSTTPTNNIVYFGAVQANVTAASSTQLTVTVPAGATYQPITVQVAGLTGFSSKPFVVTFAGGGSIDECSFAPPVVFGTVGGDPIANTVGDLDGDGKTDLIMCDRSGTTLSVFRNTSTSGIVNSGSFASKIDFTTPSGPLGAAFGDLDGDGKPDLAIVSYATGIMSVFRNTSTPGIVSLSARADFSAPGFTSNIAIYDLDGDGKSEIIISSTFAGITVYRNTSVAGTLNASSFANGINFPTATNPFPFSVADLDGDNKPDLTVPIANTHTTEVMRNTSTTGTISFAASVTLITGLGTPPVGLGATFAATGDIDGDNKQDIVVTNPSLATFAVFRNTSTSGSLSFESRVELTSLGPAASPNLADLDGDAKIDLVGAGTNFISIFKNLSSAGVINSGSFGSPVSVTLPIGEIMSIADIDGDGLNDIVTKSTNVSILRNVNGLISPPTITSFTPTTGPIGTSVTITGTNFNTPFSNIVKINGVTANITSSTATTLTVTIPVGATSGLLEVTIGCSILFSASNFTIGAPIPTITSFTPISGPIGTTVTITGTNFDTTPANNIVMFNGTPAIVTTSSATSITAIVLTGATTGPVSVTVGANTATSTSNFTVAPFNIAFTAPLNVTVGSTPREVVVGDIDADGHQDLIVSNFGSGSIGFLKGIGNGCFESAQNFNTGPNSHGLALADINQDSNLDLIVTKGNISSSSLAVLLGNGIAFGPQSNYSTAPTPRSPNHVNVGDIDKDGWPDILVANQNPLGSFSILYNNGNGTFAVGVDFPSANGSAFFVATDDVNGDTFPDVAIANFFTGRASIFLNDGLGGFASETTYPSAAGSHYVVLKDLNGDGRPEMIVANAIANSISVFLNNGSGLFLSPTIYPTENYPTTLSVADMDNDGKLDLVVGNANSGTITAFPGDGAGGFGASKNFSVGGQPYSIATGDFDEDGNLDVVSVDLSSNKITLLRTLSNTCLPNIASFSPISGPAGTSVVISGMNFSSIPANNVVMFNGATAIVTASTSMSITTTVPIGATTGNITLTIGSNTATSATIFCIPPTAPIPINNSGCSGTSISIAASGGTNGQYRWYTAVSGGTPDTQQNATFSTPALTNTTSFWVAIHDGTCESARTEVIATVLPLPLAPTVNPINPVCPGSSLVITASGSVNGAYQWYDGTTLLTGEVNSTYSATNIIATRNFSVSLFVGACESFKTAATITLKNCTPPVIASTTTTAFLEGTVTIDLCPLLSDSENDLDLSTLQAIGTLTSGAPFTLTDCTLSINYAGMPFPGTDELTISVCDFTGLCTDQLVSIELSGDIEVFNALSPNGDGRNDTFYIEYVSILPATKNNKVQVYNRWGDLVWETENYDNTERVFTGLTTGGKELPSGTYFYKLITASSSKTGFISLKR